MVVRLHIRHDVRTCTGNNAVFKTSFHINDTAIGIAQIVQQGRSWLSRLDDELLPVGLKRSNLEVLLGALVLRNQMLKALLDRSSIHLAAARISHIIAQRDLPGQRIDIFPLRRQPWLDFHIV